MIKIMVDACNNHLGNIQIIAKMIKQAKLNGADIIKFQLYNHLLLNHDYPNYDSVKENLGRCEITKKMLESIFNLCISNDIKPCFTIFNKDRIELVKPFYNAGFKFSLKIASPNLLKEKLVKEIRKEFHDRTIYISTGMHTNEELVKAYSFYSSSNLKYLYCISRYPTKFNQIDWKECLKFQGFSDHTIGIGAGIKYIRKANRDVIYEKHFTLSRNLPGKDHQISITPDELLKLNEERNYIIGSKNYKMRWNDGI